ncbi:hypothetical protein [Curtobacterium sp. VKM Ac-1376]|uniref:hypothetical protein n=1 Tax=Curtobacterium sp. VKM Ac-1376 TaxID=123312 RepID=UPI00188AF1AA|nr:hypothetical protein [Curtobacterium sp. VKM Ac-1376]MBF4613913.1 hypothetical protein [Curtobacterium sp. VKM Ac-1376]
MTTSTIRVDHRADPSRLISAGILAFLPQLRDVDVWLQVHWLFGPHVLVNVTGDRPAVDEAQTRLVDHVSAWLAETPSSADFDEVAWVDRSVELGRLELVPGPHEPIRPDNRVEVVDRRLDTFIRDEAVFEAKGRVLARAMRDPRFVRMTERSPAENADSVYTAMCVIATSYPKWGLVSGYQAFLSHWKEQLHWSDPSGRAESVLCASFHRQKEDLVRRLEALHGGARPTSDDGAFWVEWRAAASDEADRLAAREQVLPYPLPERHERAVSIDDDTGRRWSGSDERAYSDFHAQFRRLDFTKLGNGTDFAAYRYLINCFFDLLPLLGVTPAQRYTLAFYLTEAAQIVVGETWRETIERAVTRQQGLADATPTLPWKG